MNLFPNDCVIQRIWDKAAKVFAEAGRAVTFAEWNSGALAQLANVKSRLYYEAHITVAKPVFGDYEAKRVAIYTYEEFVELMAARGWKASMFEHDDVDGIAGMWFASARSEYLATIADGVAGAVDALTKDGLVVTRWKIEDTLFDSKSGDTL